MLDLPELFAPASSVRGRTSIVCSSKIDLNPPTERVVIVTGPSGYFLVIPIRPGHIGSASRSAICGCLEWHYRRKRTDSEGIQELPGSLVRVRGSGAGAEEKQGAVTCTGSETTRQKGSAGGAS